MEWKDFVDQVTENITKNGLDGNNFAYTLKNLLHEKGDKFIKFIPDKNHLNIFAQAQDDIKLQKEDYDPITKKDYWDRNPESFAYTVKILPLLRARDDQLCKRAYGMIFDGKEILEAGINPDYRDRPEVKTIYNIVKRIDDRTKKQSEKTNDETQTRQTNNSSKVKDYLNLSDKNKEKQIRDGVRGVDKHIDIKDPKTLNAIRGFIDKLLS